MKTSTKAILTVAAGVVILCTPVPRGLDVNAWRYFAVFIAVIAGLILEPIPAAAVGLMGVFTIAGLRLAGATAGESVRWALSGFSNTTVWLIFAAFMFALGYEKTGLGKRIGLTLVKWLGRQTLGLGYAIAFTDLILAPFMPSNTARSAGTIFPVIRNLPALYGSYPGPTARRIASYLMWTAFATTCLTSSMFITALAPNLLALDFVYKSTGLRISWAEWFLGFLPVSLPLIVILPWLIYKVHPPEVRSSDEAPKWAVKELNQLGAISAAEWTMSSLSVLALGMWVLGGTLFDPTTVAGIVICLMIATRIISWEDVLGNRQAWNVLVWFATLVALADGLNKVGFSAWLAQVVSEGATGFSPVAIMFLLVAFFFAIHYLFASLTAHTTAILPLVLAAGAAVPGMPVRTFALLLAFSLGMMGVLTPYATGPAPVYFASGYINRKDFWILGFAFGVLFLIALLGIEAPYLLNAKS